MNVYIHMITVLEHYYFWQVMGTMYAVTVKGFSPSLSRFKVKDKLLQLTENCGGFIHVNDVCDIKSGAARVRFRTYDAAVR